MGMIGCGCRCFGQPKFSLEIYMSTNRAFLSLKNSKQKKLCKIKIWLRELYFQSKNLVLYKVTTMKATSNKYTD